MSEPDLHKKYDVERQKQLRPEGVNQYTDFRDPDIGENLGRDPCVDHNEVFTSGSILKDGASTKFMIVGAGHVGILHAVRLINAGFKAEDIVLVDTADGFGGTWYWNRYPGIM